MKSCNPDRLKTWRKARAAVEAVKAVRPAFQQAVKEFEGALDVHVKRAAFRRLRRLHRRAATAGKVIDGVISKAKPT